MLDESPGKLAHSLLLFCKGLGWLTSVQLPGVDRRSSMDNRRSSVDSQVLITTRDGVSLSSVSLSLFWLYGPCNYYLKLIWSNFSLSPSIKGQFYLPFSSCFNARAHPSLPSLYYVIHDKPIY